MWPHFIEEENIVIPLARAYFTQKEVGDAFGTVLRTKKSSAARRLVLGSIVHHLAGGKEGTMTFLARCGETPRPLPRRATFPVRRRSPSAPFASLSTDDRLTGETHD